MEKDLVAFARPLFNAGDQVVGTVTSGGTESILLAVQGARDAQPGVADPVMIIPTTIHAAFNKAAHYFGVERISVDVDPVTKRADPAAMTAAMDQYSDRVVLVAASAPSYAHGVIDPIGAIAAETLRRGLRFHVDACIGGWVLPWAERLGRTIDPWDFRVPGITSISADLHKYAYTPKGVSLLLHATPELRKSQYFASADWPGYTILNATFLARILAQRGLHLGRQYRPLPGIGRRRLGAAVSPRFQVIDGVDNTSADLPIRRSSTVRAVLLERATGQAKIARGLRCTQESRW